MTTPNVPHRFEIELAIDASPEQIWNAIATGPGISSWMMPAEIDARPGGEVVFHMGPDGDSPGKVTAAEADRRLVYEEDWATLAGHTGADVTPLVTEFLIEARSGGTCSVRVVTSAFGTGADWENEFFAEMERGWAPMLDNLRLYVESFPGQSASTMWISTKVAASPERAIEAVKDGLGTRSVGDTTAVRDIDAKLARSIPHHVLLRMTAPASGFLSFFSFGGDDEAGLNLIGHLFGDAAAGYVESEQSGWQSWLDEVAAKVSSPTR